VRVTLPDAPTGTWREARWRNGDTPLELERATLDVDPPHAYRQLRVYRANGDLLANESWDQSRTRGIRILPANKIVAAGEELLIRAMAWWPSPVELTAVFTWKGSE
jgi:hypothetical protein